MKLHVQHVPKRILKHLTEKKNILGNPLENRIFGKKKLNEDD
jgi:hypothetical protein